MLLLFPICYPTAKLLDLLLGTHTLHLYRRDELRTLVELHQATEGKREPEKLRAVETELVGAALGLADRRVRECMRPVGEVYAVSEGLRVRDVDLKEVRFPFSHSFSRRG